MAKELVTQPEYVIKCDMCGKEKKHFWTNKRYSAVMGSISSQSDRWDKDISFTMSASIPYHPSEDICTDCAKEAFKKIIDSIEKGE